MKKRGLKMPMALRHVEDEVLVLNELKELGFSKAEIAFILLEDRSEEVTEMLKQQGYTNDEIWPPLKQSRLKIVEVKKAAPLKPSQEAVKEKISQKDAVFRMVTTFLGDKYNPKVPVKKSDLYEADLCRQLYDLFKNGTLKRGVEESDTSLKSYCANMIQHWVRRDKRLNGGHKCQTVKPVENDRQIIELLKLYKTLSTPEEENEVKDYIIARLFELTEKKSA